jgi:hypothetical protein
MRRTLIKQVGVRDGSTTMEGCRGGAAKEDGRDLELQATVANGGVRGRKMEAEGTGGRAEECQGRVDSG